MHALATSIWEPTNEPHNQKQYERCVAVAVARATTTRTTNAIVRCARVPRVFRVCSGHPGPAVGIAVQGCGRSEAVVLGATALVVD